MKRRLALWLLYIFCIVGLSTVIGYDVLASEVTMIDVRVNYSTNMDGVTITEGMYSYPESQSNMIYGSILNDINAMFEDSNYSLLGVYLDEDYSIDFTPAYSFNSSQNLKLYLKLEKKSVKVKFITYGATAISDVTVNKGGKLSSVGTTEYTDEEHKYYSFDGWYLDSSYDTKYTLDYVFNEDTYLYAKYNVVYPIEYRDLNGVKLNDEEINVEEGSEYSILDEYSKDKFVYYTELGSDESSGVCIDTSVAIEVYEPVVFYVYDKFTFSQFDMVGNGMTTPVLPKTKCAELIKEEFERFKTVGSYRMINYGNGQTIVNNFDFNLWDFSFIKDNKVVDVVTIDTTNGDDLDFYSNLVSYDTAIVTPRLTVNIDHVWEDSVGFFNRREIVSLGDLEYSVYVIVPNNGILTLPFNYGHDCSLYDLINNSVDISDEDLISSINLDESDIDNKVLTDLNEPTIMEFDSDLHVDNIYINRNIRIANKDIFSGEIVGTSRYVPWNSSASFNPVKEGYNIWAYSLMPDEGVIGGNVTAKGTTGLNRTYEYSPITMKRINSDPYNFNAYAYVAKMPTIIVDFNGGHLKGNSTLKTSEVSWRLVSPSDKANLVISKSDDSVTLKMPSKVEHGSVQNTYSESAYNPVIGFVNTLDTVGYDSFYSTCEYADSIKVEYADGAKPSWLEYNREYILRRNSESPVFNDFVVDKWYGITADEFAENNLPIVDRTNSDGSVVTFEGYWTAKEGGVRADKMSIQELYELGDCTVYARWSDGGVDEVEDHTVNIWFEDSIYRTITVKDGESIGNIRLPLGVASNDSDTTWFRVYLGYYTTSNFEVGTEFDLDDKVFSDLDIYLKVKYRSKVIYVLDDGYAYLNDGNAHFNVFWAEEGSTVKLPDKPDIITDDLSFDGWYSYDVEIVDNEFVVNNHSYTFIRTNISGKTSTVKYTTNCDIEDKEEVLNYGEYLKHWDLKREGYTLDGWYYDEELTNRCPTITVKAAKPEYILYAKWVKNVEEEYTVTYMIGDYVYDTITVKHGSTLNVPTFKNEEVPPEAGGRRRYDSWWYDAEFSTEKYVSQRIVENTTLYLKTVEIRGIYYLGDTTQIGNVWKHLVVDLYSEHTMLGCPPWLTEDQFCGWEDSKGNKYEGTITITDYLWIHPIVLDEPAKEYSTINFVTNCKQDIEPVVVESGSTIKIPTIHNDGYSLDGWYFNEDLVGARYTNDFVFTDKEYTLYAKWSESDYCTVTVQSTVPDIVPNEVTYNVLKGSTFSVDDIDVHYQFREGSEKAMDDIDFCGFEVNGEEFKSSVVTNNGLYIRAVWEADMSLYIVNASDEQQDHISYKVRAPYRITQYDLQADYNKLTGSNVIFKGVYYDDECEDKVFDGIDYNVEIDQHTSLCVLLDDTENPVTPDEYCRVIVNRNLGDTEPNSIVVKKGDKLGYISMDFEGSVEGDDDPDTSARFIGFYNDLTGEEVNEETVVSSDMSITGLWEVRVNVYNSIDYNVISKFIRQSNDVNLGQLFDFSKDGYKYAGTYYDSGYATKVEYPIAINYPINLYELHKQQCSITYHNPHGNDIVQLVNVGGQRDKSIDDRLGYDKDAILDGWYYDSDYSERFIEGTSIMNDIDLYALWYEAVYFIDGDAVEIQYVKYGDLVEDIGIPKVPSVGKVLVISSDENEDKDGNEKEFLGWSSTKDIFNKFDFDSPILKTTYIYAFWKDNTGEVEPGKGYKVTFKYPYKDDVVISVKESAFISEPVVNDCPGDIRGWYTDEGFGNLFNFKTSIYQDLTLYACVECKVTFELHNNTNEVKEQYVLYNNEINKPKVSRNGYSLDGWYLDTNYSNKYDFSNKVLGNLTLHAKWNSLISSSDNNESNTTSGNSSVSSNTSVIPASSNIATEQEQEIVQNHSNDVIVYTSDGIPVSVINSSSKTTSTIKRLPQTGIDYLIQVGRNNGSLIESSDGYLMLVDADEVLNIAKNNDSEQAKLIAKIDNRPDIRIIIIVALALVGISCCLVVKHIKR